MGWSNRIAVWIRGRGLTESERCVEKILDFFGIDCRTLEPGQLHSVDIIAESNESPRYSVLITASRLAEVLKTEPFVEFPPLLSRAESLFVFDFDDSANSKQLLRWLTRLPGADIGVLHPAPHRVSITKDAPEVCGVLSGVAAMCSNTEGVRIFLACHQSEGYRSLVVIGEGDVFFESRNRGVPIFMSASGLALDIDRPVAGNFFDVRNCFPGVVPLVIFLKRAFPDAFSSNQDISASLIIDDPALKRRYGFLDFSNVLTTMNQHNFATTIAFIPWNWRRTNRRTADIFLNNPDRYSLVVHGCDHTSSEFGTRSVPVLNRKAKIAHQRIEGHRQRTGIQVSPIMVFPQGVFSREAARVLKLNNFIAAVNTEVNPFGEDITNTEVRELWNVAIMKYSTFPIFTRRYMSHGLVNFAFDAFLGKPCLLVAHHEVFKDGSRELTTFVDSLNSLPGGIRWRSLENVIRASYLSQENADGTWGVRMFANEMVFENRSKQPTTILVTKQETDAEAIKSVKCEQQETERSCQGGYLRFRAEVPPERTATIRVEYDDTLGEIPPREGLSYRLKVGVRRYLSEVRDDYICRSEFLNSCAARLIRLPK
jgi:hypothetical protein